MDAACVFARALLAQQIGCECATRSAVGEQLSVGCAMPVARHNCLTLWRLAYERARFALQLPAEGQRLAHAQALRLQCGTLAALRAHVDSDATDVHRLVARAHDANAAFSDLPWGTLVPALVAWQPARRSSAR